MELVDKCHQAGIGVIMDFVPIHFATDYYGLANYDGTQLYEYVQSDVQTVSGEHVILIIQEEKCAVFCSRRQIIG